MKSGLSFWFRDFLALVYPRNCAGCGQTLSHGEDLICTICKYELPKTGYLYNAQNKFVRKFYGRIKVEFAIAYLHFHKEGITQHLLHNFKYRNQPEIGEKLGEWFGADLIGVGFRDKWEMIIPVPLHKSKEKSRGYNQSNFFASGLAKALGISFSFDSVIRKRKSETQTHKSRQERWQNVEGIFEVKKTKNIKGRHLLLVDDVVTTGATLESCGAALLESGAASLSFATLAIAH